MRSKASVGRTLNEFGLFSIGTILIFSLDALDGEFTGDFLPTRYPYNIRNAFTCILAGLPGNNMSIN